VPRSSKTHGKTGHDGKDGVVPHMERKKMVGCDKVR
jgi:hypothetical protein